MTEVTYNQFRSLHKGTPQSEISALWKKYKAGDYALPSDEEVVETPAEVPVEAPVEETVEEAVEAPKPKSKKKKELSPLDKCNEYERYRRELLRFSFKYNEEETQKVLDRMAELARETLPEGYTCEPTDSWKIWFGPTRECLLINTTRQMAFKVDRDWWKTHYQTTIYVDRELLDDPTHIETEKFRYARKKKYVPRTPVVGLECKLPRSYKDIKIRGGQAGGR